MANMFGQIKSLATKLSILSMILCPIKPASIKSLPPHPLQPHCGGTSSHDSVSIGGHAVWGLKMLQSSIILVIVKQSCAAHAGQLIYELLCHTRYSSRPFQFFSERNTFQIIQHSGRNLKKLCFKHLPAETFRVCLIHGGRCPKR